MVYHIEVEDYHGHIHEYDIEAKSWEEARDFADDCGFGMYSHYDSIE